MADAKPSGAAGASQGAGPGDLDEGSSGGGVPEAPQGNIREGIDETHDGEPAKTPEQKALEDTVKAGEAKAEAKEEPASEEPEKGSDDWHKQFIETGNAHGDAAIELMKEAGVSPIEANAVFQAAIESGDLKDVKWDILENKIGKSKTALVKAGVEQFYEGEYKQRVAVVESAHKIMGSEENWVTVRDWAQKAEKSDPALKSKIDNIRKGIDVGGDVANFAVESLKKLYEEAPNNKGLGTKNITTGSRPGPKTSSDGISQVEFMKQTHALHELGAESNDPRFYKLFERRQAGKVAGI